MTKLETVQYRTALVISEAFKATWDCLFKERGWQSLAQRKWSRKSFFFHRILNGLASLYPQSCLTNLDPFYQTRSSGQVNINQYLSKLKSLSNILSILPWEMKQFKLRNSQYRVSQ